MTASPRGAVGDEAAIRESVLRLRGVVERAVLAELCLCTATQEKDLPTGFRWAFEGTGFPDAWFDLFVRDAAFRIKDNADFERIWNAEQTALIKAIVEASAAVLA